MCGIAGIVHSDSAVPVDYPLLERMRDVACHRGPDDAGIWTQGPVGLAHRRLSVLDLAGGHQPMGDAMSGIWLTYNGEIYNFKDLRRELEERGHTFRTHGDTEVVLKAYQEFGTQMPSRLEGMFALAIWDGPNKRLFLSRDRFGVKPLYYSVLPWGIVFASEIRSLMAHPRVPKDLDWHALGLYLRLEYVPAPRSFFKSICKLKAGHSLIYEVKNFRTECYWDLDHVQPLADVDEKEAMATVEDLLHHSVQSMLVSDVPLGVFLSGGLDSTAILNAACDSARGRIKTFSVAIGDCGINEAGHAEALARRFGTDHHTVQFSTEELLNSVSKVLSHLDEPLADASTLPTYMLCEATRRYLTVALSGEGGDELFAGYPTHLAHRLCAYYMRMPEWLRVFMKRQVSAALPVSDSHMSLDYKFRKFVEAAEYPPLTRNFLWWGAYDTAGLRRVLHPDIFSASGPFDLEDLAHEYASLARGGNGLSGVLLWDLKFYLQDDLLTKMDRMSMAHSLEVRVPFLDSKLVEYVTSLPAHFKLKGFQSKYLLRKMLRGKVPNNIVNRKKMGFDVPLARWLKRELRDLTQDCLGSSRLRESGIFNEAEVARLLADHQAGRANNRQKIWPLVVFESWKRSFCNGVRA